jgi:GNAT superfamily N-acetyltransferase
MATTRASEYVYDDDRDRVDVDTVWDFLATQAYWARWRTRDVFEQQLGSAWRVVGAYHQPSGDQVGFCRAVSDGCAVAYLADVFVVPEHRGHGLGKGLVRVMIDEGPGARFLWMLHTRDAADLYAKFGFAPRADGRYAERPARFV